MGKEISKKKIGKNLLMGALLAGSVMIPMYNVNAAETPTITYSAHVEDHAWMKEVSTSDKDAFAGTQGEARRMEALKIKLEGLDDVTLRYTVHIEDYGNKDFTSEDEVIGTTGEAKRLEGITVYADGLEDTDYALQYRVHIENEGTSEWVNAGEFAGSQGKAQRLESIQFRIVDKTKAELEAFKELAVNQLKAEFPASNYTLNAKDYNEAMEDAIKAINENSTSTSEVSSALKDAQDALKLIPSDEKEKDGLQAAKDDAKSTFISEVAAVDLSSIDNTIINDTEAKAAILKAVNGALTDGISRIDNASTSTGVTNALTAAQKNLVSEVKKATKAEVTKLYTAGKDDKFLKSAKYTAAITAIDADGADIDAMVGAYVTNAVAANMETIDDAKTAGNTALTAIEEAADGLGVVANKLNNKETKKFAELDRFKSIIESIENKIEKAENGKQVGDAVKEAETKLLAEMKAYANEMLKKYESGKKVDSKILAKADYKTANTDINKKSATIASIVTALSTADGKLSDLSSYETQAESDVTDLSTEAKAFTKELKDIVSTTTTDSNIEKAVKDAKDKIKAAATQTAIEAIPDEVEEEILALIKTYAKSVVNKLSTSATVEYNSKTYDLSALNKSEVLESIEDAANVAAVKAVFTDVIFVTEVA